MLKRGGRHSVVRDDERVRDEDSFVTPSTREATDEFSDDRFPPAGEVCSV
jgi:hypothetical protein